jgi:ComF family protein
MIRWLADILSPPRCAACSLMLSRGGVVFCASCAATVERCDSTESCLAFALYGGALAHAIHRFKYEDATYLARPLGALLRMACRAARLRVDLVVPVPLHVRRLSVRGYNQSALLAYEAAHELEAPSAARALWRVVDTASQVELSRAERLANVRGAFRARSPIQVQGRSIALVDDVITTGATLAACTSALLDAGARSVTSVVLARTPTDLSLDRPAPREFEQEGGRDGKSLRG